MNNNEFYSFLLLPTSFLFRVSLPCFWFCELKVISPRLVSFCISCLDNRILELHTIIIKQIKIIMLPESREDSCLVKHPTPPLVKGHRDLVEFESIIKYVIYLDGIYCLVLLPMYHVYICQSGKTTKRNIYGHFVFLKILLLILAPPLILQFSNVLGQVFLLIRRHLVVLLLSTYKIFI